MSDSTEQKLKRFGELASVDDVLQWISAEATSFIDRGGSESVSSQQSLGRLLTQNLLAEHSLPPFRRAMMDGVAVVQTRNPSRCFAVRDSSDSENCTSQNALPVQTGMPLTEYWDTVIPIEALVDINNQPVNVLKSETQIQIKADTEFPVGANIAEVGEDICAGQIALSAGRRIRIQDIALLAALDAKTLTVRRRPEVEILVTGDELSNNEQVGSYRIHDANSPVLRHFVDRDGGQVIGCSSVGDCIEDIQQAILQSKADVSLISGGTSVGPRDFIADIVARHGQLQFHGINMRPGRPMGVGKVDEKIVFLLPGNPVACQFGYELLARPFLQLANGFDSHWPYRQQTVRLNTVVKSQLGRVDYLRIKMDGTEATPITSGRASNLSTLTQADGFVIVPAEVASYDCNSTLTAYLFDA